MALSRLRGARGVGSSARSAAAAWRGLAAAAGGSGGGGDERGGASRPGGDGPSSPVPSSSSAKPQVIRVDRSGLMPSYAHPHDDGAAAHKEPETEMARHLKALIRFRGGPITLAEYMSEVLTNPTAGYYTQRDVFGAAGDFVTSPEISQMFGEMVGIWCVAAWQQMGAPPALRLVELGPGRGTLMADLLRGTSAFPAFSAALSVGLVEVSPVLRAAQWAALRCAGAPPAEGAATPAGVSAFGGARVAWHRSLEEVDESLPTIYIAHEFMDALPVHQFQKTERGWCERLVDIASPDSPLHLRLVLSPGATPAARVLLPRRLQQLPLKQRAALKELEICPQGMATAQALARRVGAHGGAALVVDYGQDGPYGASLQASDAYARARAPRAPRAIRQHEFVGLLERPGSADLSARVDFGALRRAAAATGAPVACYGPIPQAHFLLSLGIEARLQQLSAGATPAQAAALREGLHRLVGGGAGAARPQDEGMGHSYKAFAIAPADAEPPFPFAAQERGDQGSDAAQQQQQQPQQGQQQPSPGQP
eukprot:scaffold1.g5187.t1